MKIEKNVQTEHSSSNIFTPSISRLLMFTLTSPERGYLVILFSNINKHPVQVFIFDGAISPN